MVRCCWSLISMGQNIFWSWYKHSEALKLFFHVRLKQLPSISSLHHLLSQSILKAWWSADQTWFSKWLRAWAEGMAKRLTKWSVRGSELLVHAACLCPLIWRAFDPRYSLSILWWSAAGPTWRHHLVGLIGPSSCWAFLAAWLSGTLWPSTPSLPELRSKWGVVFQKVSNSSPPMAWPCSRSLGLVGLRPPPRLTYTRCSIFSNHGYLYHHRFCWLRRLRWQGCCTTTAWTCWRALSFLGPHSRLAVFASPGTETGAVSPGVECAAVRAWMHWAPYFRVEGKPQ